MSDKTNIKFQKSDKPAKKYKATFIDPKTKREKTVYFGDPKYQQFKDSTPLKLYKHLDHNDPKRRELYYMRHPKDYPKYSPDWLSKKYLW
jgi:hypothetical protein